MGRRPDRPDPRRDPHHNDLRRLKLTLAYRKRALPLLGACYAPGGQPEPMTKLIVGLLHEAATCPPAGAEVTLLADSTRGMRRGYSW